MSRKRLIWKLYPSYLLVVLVALAAVSWYASTAVRTYFRGSTRTSLQQTGSMLGYMLSKRWPPESSAALQERVREIGDRTSMRITVMNLQGTVLAESRKELPLEDHSNRPEFQQAVKEGLGISTRYSNTLRQNMMYVAQAFYMDGDMAGVIRTSKSLIRLNQTLQRIYHRLFLGGLVVAVLAAGVSFVIASRITAPLRDMRGVAERLAGGDFRAHMRIPESQELAEVATAVNTMAQELHHRMEAVVRNRNELQAILASMAEGVLAVNADEVIIRVNEAACRMLAVNQKQARGRLVQEVVRNSHLLELVHNALEQAAPVQSQILFHQGIEETYLQVRAHQLRTESGERLGVVVVLNDVTRLKRLENLRREFAANVSHELRTPVTSIKGFVETLLDGALEDPPDARKFLNIILTQADRLNTLIRDLMLLSRIEDDAESGELATQTVSLRPRLENAVDTRLHKVRDKNIELEIQCPQDLRVTVHAVLFEQAVANLVDNAVNYSNPGTRVLVTGHRDGDEICVSVSDEGCGIAPSHVKRLFERFYRVDKARSRELGGTGLGLAIVKHVMQAHGGHISVDSTPGEGSTFTIHLPVPPRK